MLSGTSCSDETEEQIHLTRVEYLSIVLATGELWSRNPSGAFQLRHMVDDLHLKIF